MFSSFKISRVSKLVQKLALACQKPEFKVDENKYVVNLPNFLLQFQCFHCVYADFWSAKSCAEWDREQLAIFGNGRELFKAQRDLKGVEEVYAGGGLEPYLIEIPATDWKADGFIDLGVLAGVENALEKL